MIHFKLHELMAKKKIFKISELVEMTKQFHPGGIDRRTLTKIRSGQVDRLDMFILDVLCQVFKCAVSDIMKYVPLKDRGHKIRPARKKNKAS